MSVPSRVGGRVVGCRVREGRLQLSLAPATSHAIEVLLGEAMHARIRLGRGFDTSVLEVADACGLHARWAALTRAVPHAEPLGDNETTVPGVWVTTQTAAEQLGITARAVRKRIGAGTLPARRVADRWQVRLAA